MASPSRSMYYDSSNIMKLLSMLRDCAVGIEAGLVCKRGCSLVLDWSFHDLFSIVGQLCCAEFFGFFLLTKSEYRHKAIYV